MDTRSHRLAWTRRALGLVLLTTLACSDSPGVLGRDPGDGGSTRLATVLAWPDSHRSRDLMLEGTLDEVCPTVGCWAYLSDDGARLRLEFRSFTLTGGDRGRRCRIVGRLTDQEGEPVLSVHGLRFEDAP